jgi:HEPN domain-containing protein
MSDARSMPEGLPPGAIHLGTFTAVGPGQFVSGVLKLSNDPEADLLNTANSFRMAADRCLTSCKVMPGVEMLTVPGAVCAALASELYLKLIHLKESGHSSHGHDLVELFTSLGESTRAALVEIRSDIEEVLERNRSHFTGARYHHEVAQFSFRQQELLQLAESLSAWVQARYKGTADAPTMGA